LTFVYVLFSYNSVGEGVKGRLSVSSLLFNQLKREGHR